ncbi:MAG: hypothetical protein JSS89_10475 [Bacteroidetes bacterium]|nr:hypothetical protein [Bacteroidota bacterium]
MLPFRLLLALGVMWFTTSAIGSAQRSSSYASDHVGTWDYQYYTEKAAGGYRSESNYSLSATQLASFKHKLEAIVECLHQNPTVRPPVGFEPTVRASVWTDAYAYHYNPALLKDKIPQGEIVLQFCPFYHVAKKGTIEKGCIEVSHLDVKVNDLFSTIDRATYDRMSPDQINATAVQMPVVYKTFAPGVTLYENGTIVVADPKRPYLVPITVREYYNMAIPYWEVQAAKDGNSAVLDYVKKDLAAFTAEELDMPAYVGAHTETSMILVTSRPTKQRWMRLDPNYFDRSRPRESVQLITIYTMIDAFVDAAPTPSEATDSGYHWHFARVMDWALFGRLLDK